VKNILNGKVLIAMLAIALLLLSGSLVYILVMRPAADSNPALAAATPAVTIIPAATSTALPQPPTLTGIPPTQGPTLTPEAGQIAIGVYVQPNTGGVGLRIHTDASLSAGFFSAFDSEVFLVDNGPDQADGYTWWHLTASYDKTRAGWAVQDYLSAIPSP
jgi:hypothetical protein